MKNYMKYIIAAAALLIGVAAGAQVQSGINAQKSVKDNGDGTYTLTLESFVTGKIVHEQEAVTGAPLDIVLVLDVSGSMSLGSPSRISYLRTAVKQFITTVAASDNDSRVSIIKFASAKKVNSDGSPIIGNESGATQVVYDLTDVKAGKNAEEMKKKLDVMYADGNTSADYGMELADYVIANSGRATSNKVVIMFTDGEPTHGSGSFQEPVASAAIAAAKNLKDASTLVYTIGCFESSPAAGSNVDNYMNYTSSNYPDATSMSSHGTKKESKYYYEASDASKLSSIFDAIYQDIPKTISDEKRDVNSSEIYDEITNEFSIPRGDDGKIDASKVSFYVRQLVAVDASSEDRSQWKFTFGSDEPITDTEKYGSVSFKVDSKDGLDNVTVEGFKFQENFCGPEVMVDGTVKPHGAELVIKIIIEQNSEGEGGVVKTNTENSGIYINGTNTTPIILYPIPVAPADKNITVKRNGLKNGESSIYTVVPTIPEGKFSEEVLAAIPSEIRLILTEGAPEATIKVKSAIRDSETQAIIPIKYTVTEEAWNWKYETAPSSKSISKEVLVIGGTSEEPVYSYSTLFEFSGDQKTVKVKNAEKTK